jgi:glycine/D-amino acid oxidase-like deaminating enzyme
MKLTSYWLDTAPAFENGAEGDVPTRADAAIVGGGFTGLSQARALARRKASVVVLEAGRIIGEASGRNGGQCNNGLAHDYAALAQRLGNHRARIFYRAYSDAVDTVERLVKEEAIDCDFDRRGRLKLAAKPEHYRKLASAYEVLRAEVDPDVQLIPRERMAEVMEGRTERNPWRVLDWPSIPGHFGKPWFLPLVGAYYRAQDILR